MGAQAGSIGSIVLGVVLVVVGAFTGGALILPGIMLIIGGVVGLAFRPKSDTQQNAQSQELKIAAAATGIPVPVVFGTARVTPNYLRYSTDAFVSEPVKAESAGGKGGASPSPGITGYKYYLKWEYGLCVGPVDQVGQVFSMPGEIPMVDSGDPWVDFSGDSVELSLESLDPNAVGRATLTTNLVGDNNDLVFKSKSKIDSTQISIEYVDPLAETATETVQVVGKEITVRLRSVSGILSTAKQVMAAIKASDAAKALVSVKKAPNNDGTGSVTDMLQTFLEFSSTGHGNTLEQGVCRVYQGNPNQTRVSSGDRYASSGIPYKNLCWVMMGVTDSDKGFLIGAQPQPRTHQFMIRRLPRCMRDDGTTVTGLKTRGSDDPSDQAYWQANPAAIYWEVITNKLWGRGLSSDSLDEESFIAVSEFYAAKNIGLGLLLENPDSIGEFLAGIQKHCKTLLTWDGEVYKLSSMLDLNTTHGEILTLRDAELVDFAITVPLWPSVTNELRAEFNSGERGERPDIVTAQDLGSIAALDGRITSERIQLPGFNRWNLAFQQLARLLADTSYPYRQADWQMNRFKSHIAIGQVVRVITTEFTDTTATSYWLVLAITDGDSDSDNIKVTAVEDAVLCPITGEELSPTIPKVHPWERIIPVNPDDVYLPDDLAAEYSANSVVAEVPAILAHSKNKAEIIVGTQRQIAAHTGATVDWSRDGSTFHPLSFSGAIITGGQLTTALPTGQFWDRSAAGFQFQADNADLAPEELSEATLVQADVENLETLLNTPAHFLLVEEEIIQIGFVEHLGAGLFRIRNYIRGRFGTPIRSHAIDALAYYFKTEPVPMVAGGGVGEELTYRVSPFTGTGLPIAPPSGETQTVQIFHPAPHDGVLLGLSLSPLEPEPVSIVDGGATVTLTVRPRRFDAGGGVKTFYDAMKKPIRDLGGMTFAVAQVKADGTLLNENPIPNDSTFTAGDLTTASKVELTVTKLTGANTFRVFAVREGYNSVNFAELTT